MRLRSLFPFGCDDQAADPARWSRAKLEGEIERLEHWLRVMSLPSLERIALQKVLLGLYCESARRRRPLSQVLHATST
jgi:hypothetical protein